MIGQTIELSEPTAHDHTRIEYVLRVTEIQPNGDLVATCEQANQVTGTFGGPKIQPLQTRIGAQVTLRIPYVINW
jgi:hypothetical protein